MTKYMTAQEWIVKNFRDDAVEAADYLRLCIDEVENDPQGLLNAVSYVAQARGGIEDLALTTDERAALANAIGRSLARGAGKSAHAAPHIGATLLAA